MNFPFYCGLHSTRRHFLDVDVVVGVGALFRTCKLEQLFGRTLENHLITPEETLADILLSFITSEC